MYFFYNGRELGSQGEGEGEGKLSDFTDNDLGHRKGAAVGMALYSPRPACVRQHVHTRLRTFKDSESQHSLLKAYLNRSFISTSPGFIPERLGISGFCYVTHIRTTNEIWNNTQWRGICKVRNHSAARS